MALVPTPSEGYNNVASGTAAIMNALNGSRQGSSSVTDWGAAAGYNYRMMKETMRYNRKERQKNRDWQEYMSNTSYQRAVKDMLEAGINPILAYTQGGASTPSGGQRTGAARAIGRSRKSRSYGISGLAEGLGQIIDAAEGFGDTNTGKRLGRVRDKVMDMIVDMAKGSNKPSSRTGDFGGHSAGGSFRG